MPPICRIISLEKELDSLGGKVAATRGGMIHLVLSLCRQFEDAFSTSIDGGKGGVTPQMLFPDPHLIES